MECNSLASSPREIFCALGCTKAALQLRSLADVYRSLGPEAHTAKRLQKVCITLTRKQLYMNTYGELFLCASDNDSDGLDNIDIVAFGFENGFRVSASRFIDHIVFNALQ